MMCYDDFDQNTVYTRFKQSLGLDLLRLYRTVAYLLIVESFRFINEKQQYSGRRKVPFRFAWVHLIQNSQNSVCYTMQNWCLR